MKTVKDTRAKGMAQVRKMNNEGAKKIGERMMDNCKKMNGNTKKKK